jgi:hypothetical protein
MLYSELAKTYRKLFKKYPNISSLQDFSGKILEEKTTYIKRGARWIEVRKEKKKYRQLMFLMYLMQYNFLKT